MRRNTLDDRCETLALVWLAYVQWYVSSRDLQAQICSPSVAHVLQKPKREGEAPPKAAETAQTIHQVPKHSMRDEPSGTPAAALLSP